MSLLFDRSHALTAGILAFGLLVLVFVLQDLNDPLPALPRLEPSATAAGVFGPDSARMPEFFSPASFASLSLITNLPPPFATTFFQPQPPRPVAANATRKVMLTYNGFFETSTGDKRAYVMVGDSLKVLPSGTAVVSDLLIANIQRAELTLKRASTQEVVIPFRGSKEIEVPAQ